MYRRFLNLKRLLIVSTFLTDFSNATLIFLFTLIIGQQKSAYWLSLLWASYYGGSFVSHLVMVSYVDRLTSRFLMLGSEVSRWLIVTTLLVNGNFNRPLNLVIIVCLLGIVEPIFHPAEVRLLTEAFSPTEMVQINAILELSGQSTTIIGPFLATLLTTWFNARFTLTVMSVILFSSVIIVLMMPTSTVGKNKIPVSSLQTSLSTFIHSSALRHSASLMFLLNTLFIGTVVPVLLKFIQRFGPHANFNYTLLTASQSIGLILMAAHLAHKPVHQTNLLKRNLCTVLFIAGLLALISMTTKLYLLILWFLLIGLLSAIFDVENNLLFQNASPHSEIGRMYVFKGLINVGSVTLGTILANVVLNWLSVQQLYFGCAVFLLLISLWLLLHHSFK
ncbi:MFS transporter [Lactobacillus rossiae]|uniref:MFS transporter n=1 Tax=Furfurilactobacillus rossiae TaxID=231049 RepID=A0A7C9MWB6_9LACO|nr:MFS transporter [Furfurilactobacillus milii]